MFGLHKNNDAQRSDVDQLSQRLREEIERYTELNAELRRKHKEADDIIKEARKLTSRMQRDFMALRNEVE